jgi:hypothetical protein
VERRARRLEKLLTWHLAQRLYLYRRARAAGQERTARAIRRDAARLLGVAADRPEFAALFPWPGPEADHGR